MKLAATNVPISTVWTSPDAPRDIDAPATAAQPDVAGWAKSMDTETRLGLHGRTLTQLLFAEPVLVRTERDGWSEILAPWQPSSQDELGYPGWIPSSHLGELPQSASDPVAIDVPTASLLAEPDGRQLAELSFATVLASLEHADGYTRVATPDAGSGWIADDALRSVVEPSGPEDRLRLGELFLGLEYLWGGTSAHGLDCSGLIHTVSRVLGLRIRGTHTTRQTRWRTSRSTKRSRATCTSSAGTASRCTTSASCPRPGCCTPRRPASGSRTSRSPMTAGQPW